jgi:hypothetical protein
MRSLCTRRTALGLVTIAAMPGAAGRAGGSAMSTIAEAADAYLTAWARKDLDGIAAHLHTDVHFKAPMQELTGRQQVLAAAARVFPLLERIDTRARSSPPTPRCSATTSCVASRSA